MVRSVFDKPRNSSESWVIQKINDEKLTLRMYEIFKIYRVL